MTSESSESTTKVVHLRLRPGCVDRFLEYFDSMVDHINANEPSGNIKYDLFRNNADGNEYTIVETFKSAKVMEAWFASPKHVEVGTQVMAEGLMDGEPVERHCTKVSGTRS